MTKAFRTGVLTQWLAPYTGGARKVLPVGLEFVVLVDPPPQARAVGADSIPHKHWETLLVDDEERAHELYAGYHLVVHFEHLASHCERIKR